ncbi:histidyl-tRNA synthetase [Mollisia scopiformis]|uniref:histidine--tRNA ligase n=1 Tax=Mollisia scopiformis TaxID=149040 RepID=A0A194XIX2_MOLSC|nr:histidyl-tRNA synthetase [Mollisia scopiformis]KUJ20076.1 histidyl-tRNA synthetase [Mollisia scopiformis]
MSAKKRGAEVARGGVQLKTPKGTVDSFGKEVILREQVTSKISDIFRRHGGNPLDTPVFELKEILTGKYGEDAKLIYDLQDQGGEACALRFDLTVPLARWVAMNNVTQVKRYHIGNVYRRDQPAIARGRLRAFQQADFDIVGQYDPMIADSEILRIIVEVFKSLEININIKMNHRRILDGLFVVAGVPEEKVRAISSAVDKLDKLPWAEVKKEMVGEKGLPEEVADRIGEYVQHSGNIDKMLQYLRADATLCANESVKEGLADMELLATYLQAYGITDRVIFDFALARGLDYYTGLIYEIIFQPTAAEAATIQVGSIGAGGRYDNLVGMYGRRTAPCVGISFGVDRILSILKAQRTSESQLQTEPVEVYVMAFGSKDFGGLLPERMAVTAQLWDGGIRAEFMSKVKPKLPNQFKAAVDVPIAVILGEDELKEGKVRVKALGLPDGHPEKEGVLIQKSELVAEVQKRLAR